jgi:hypothetical protein
MRTEPVALMSLLRAGIALLMAFGLNLTNEQTVAVVLFAEALTTVWTRSKVSPVDSRGELRTEPPAQR